MNNKVLHLLILIGEKMEDKEQLILEFMKDINYVPMKAKEMALMLSVPKTEYSAFLEVLNHLEEEYKIQKIIYSEIICSGSVLAEAWEREVARGSFT